MVIIISFIFTAFPRRYTKDMPWPNLNILLWFLSFITSICSRPLVFLFSSWEVRSYVMPRTSAKTSASAKTSGSTRKDNGTQKRALDEPAGTTSLPKRPKRASTSGLKSKYFESKDAAEDSHGTTPSASDHGSGYEEDSAPAESSEGSERSEVSEEDEPPRQPRGKGREASRTAKGGGRALNGTDLAKAGVKTGLGPGTQVIMKKPKARSPGKVPYSDDTIHPNTILFLRELKENNRREWLKGECGHIFCPL